MDRHDPEEPDPMRPATIAAQIADDAVDAMLSAARCGDCWGGPVVIHHVGGVPVVVGVVDLEPGADLAGERPSELFAGWWDTLELFATLADDERRGRPSLRLLLPGPAVIGGVRPHVEPRQAFRSRRIVGATNVDRVVRLLWNHGRELVRLASPSVVVRGGAFAFPRCGGRRLVQTLVRWCHRLDRCVGFGAVDLGTWAVAGVRSVDRLKHARDNTSPLREVVELVEHQLEANHARR